MTVQELFAVERIDLDFITELGDINFYWNSCAAFISQNWRRDVETLSPKQNDWCYKILEDAVEQRIEGKQRA